MKIHRNVKRSYFLTSFTHFSPHWNMLPCTMSSGNPPTPPNQTITGWWMKRNKNNSTYQNKNDEHNNFGVPKFNIQYSILTTYRSYFLFDCNGTRTHNQSSQTNKLIKWLTCVVSTTYLYGALTACFYHVTYAFRVNLHSVIVWMFNPVAVGLSPVGTAQIWDIAPVSSKEFLDI